MKGMGGPKQLSVLHCRARQLDSDSWEEARVLQAGLSQERKAKKRMRYSGCPRRSVEMAEQRQPVRERQTGCTRAVYERARLVSNPKTAGQLRMTSRPLIM
jgi:hypothetical protein